MKETHDFCSFEISRKLAIKYIYFWKTGPNENENSPVYEFQS